jgi:hypothetical protein
VLAGRGNHSCLQSFRAVMQEWDCDEEWESGKVKAEWHAAVGRVAQQKQADLEAVEIAERSSLQVYATLGHTYLDDWSNREGVRMVTKCRLGYVLLMKTIARVLRWPLSGGRCVMCDSGEVEDVRHFLQRCSALEVCRQRLEHELQGLTGLGAAGVELLSQYVAGGERQLRILLGAGEAAGDSEQCARAMWVVDKACKNFMSVCWKMREALLGDLQVEHGSLLRVSSKRVVTALVRAQELRPLPGDSDVGNVVSNDWEAWMPTKDRASKTRRNKGRSAFFAVWSGRRTVVFVGWAECLRPPVRGPQRLLFGQTCENKSFFRGPGATGAPDCQCRPPV